VKIVPRLTQFLIFFAIAVGLIGGMHYYLWARLIRDPSLPQAWARALTAIVVALGIALPLTLLSSRFFQGPLVRPALWFGFAWMGVGFLLVAFLGIADAGQLVAFISRKFTGSELDQARRVFLARGLAAGVGGVVAGLSAVGFRSALGPVQIKELTVKLRGLPRELSGFKLVQISDVHIGPLLRKDWLAHIVATIQGIKPDAVAITGDLVDGTVHELREHVAPLADLKAPRGVWFVTGNHEYYSGVEDWYAHLPTLGVRPLRNERAELAPGLFIAGIEDPTGSPNLADALSGHDESQALVLLAHQPRQFAEAARNSVPLTLSGHTHGGQIWPFSWLVALQQPYLAGLHRKGVSQLYVSRGTGFWGPPLRVFAPPEITLLKLVPA
jgi:predicted MPP superfamily phosphohydrolase